MALQVRLLQVADMSNINIVHQNLFEDLQFSSNSVHQVLTSIYLTGGDDVSSRKTSWRLQ